MACPRVGSGSGERSGGDPGRDVADMEPGPGGCRSEVIGRRGGRAESVYSRASSGEALSSGRGTPRVWREGRRGGLGDTARERVTSSGRVSGGVRHRRHLREGGGLARSWRSGRTPREGGYPRVGARQYSFLMLRSKGMVGRGVGNETRGGGHAPVVRGAGRRR